MKSGEILKTMACGGHLQIVKNPWGATVSWAILQGPEELDRQLVHWWQINRLIARGMLTYDGPTQSGATELLLTSTGRAAA